MIIKFDSNSLLKRMNHMLGLRIIHGHLHLADMLPGTGVRGSSRLSQGQVNPLEDAGTAMRTWGAYSHKNGGSTWQSHLKNHPDMETNSRLQFPHDERSSVTCKRKKRQTSYHSRFYVHLCPLVQIMNWFQAQTPLDCGVDLSTTWLSRKKSTHPPVGLWPCWSHEPPAHRVPRCGRSEPNCWSGEVWLWELVGRSLEITMDFFKLYFYEEKVKQTMVISLKLPILNWNQFREWTLAECMLKLEAEEGLSVE